MSWHLFTYLFIIRESDLILCPLWEKQSLLVLVAERMVTDKNNESGEGTWNLIMRGKLRFNFKNTWIGS